MIPYYTLKDFLEMEKMYKRQANAIFIPKRSQKIKSKRRGKGKKKCKQ